MWHNIIWKILSFRDIILLFDVCSFFYSIVSFHYRLIISLIIVSFLGINLLFYFCLIPFNCFIMILFYFCLDFMSCVRPIFFIKYLFFYLILSLYQIFFSRRKLSISFFHRLLYSFHQFFFWNFFIWSILTLLIHIFSSYAALPLPLPLRILLITKMVKLRTTQIKKRKIQLLTEFLYKRTYKVPS